MARVLLLVFALATSASAQWINDYTGRTFADPLSSYLDTVILHSMQQDAMAAHFAAAPTATTSVAYAAPSTFVPRRERLLIGHLAEAVTDDAGLRAQLSEALELGMQGYEAFALDQGRPHDVGLAFTFFVVVQYVLATAEQPPDAGIDALLVAIDAALAADQTFRAADDAARQTLYETLVGLAVFTSLGYEAGVSSGDPELVQLFQSAAATFLEAVLGTSIERIHLGASGLLLR
jgi:hypothetical protein